MTGTLSKPSFLNYTPTPLAFGTSGLRGLVKDITDLEAYINAKGFLNYLLRRNEVRKNDTIVIAGDLRPSTDRIMAAVARAVADLGLKTENTGKIPTPALTYFAMQSGRASIMVTGSHIPFDRNGIKFNKPGGEVLKSDESGILEEVKTVRESEYSRTAGTSFFDANGSLKPDCKAALPPVNAKAAEDYVRRYVDFFPANGLKGKKIVVYQHSAVGRDIVVRILKELGAEVLPAGRSEEFIPIDTENVTENQLSVLHALAESQEKAHGNLDAIVSTDGDSDRPLIVGFDERPDEKSRKIRFFGGDLLGIVVAEYLGADRAVVPVSANDAVDIQLKRRGVGLVKTRIGSPYVIQAMDDAKSEKKYGRIVAWEANGGFMTGTDITAGGNTLKALPTRDAVLPLLAALYSAIGSGKTLCRRFAELPPRFSKAGLLDNFPVDISRKILSRFSSGDPSVPEMDFRGPKTPGQAKVQSELSDIFAPKDGFGEIVRIDCTDGIRIYFSNGDIAHVRPSGNAPQLRIYSVSDREERAAEIVALGLREPDGLLRRLEKFLS